MPEVQDRAPVTLPDYNVDDSVHDFAETAGAHIGGLVTAGITGLFNLGAGLFRGVTEGAINTYQRGALDAQRKANHGANTVNVQLTEDEMRDLIALRQQRGS